MALFKHLVRIDIFVDMHLDYLEGTLRLVMADLEHETECDTPDPNMSVLDDFIQFCYICKKNISKSLAYSCSFCKQIICKYVCSVVHEEHIACKNCTEKDYVQRNIALCDVENWRNLGHTTKKSNSKDTNYNETGDTSTEKCIACANGDFPTGNGHRCISCNKPIHIFPGCSVPVPGTEEGFGQKAICIECAKNKQGTQKSKQSTNIEKQQNAQIQSKQIITKNRKPAKYLGSRADDVADSLRWDHNRVIPVIKNGNHPDLQSCKLQNKFVTVKNTCAFDSILYLTIFAVTDFEFLLTQVNSFQIRIFKLINLLRTSYLKTDLF